MPSVTYNGPTNRKKDKATVIYVDGVKFKAGWPVEVEDPELVKELQSGESERLKGHKFTVESAKSSAKTPDKG